MNFAVAIYKPEGISSSDVVIKCRNAFSKAVGQKIKCGHMGTLDPAADGVLVLGFGKATKLFDYVQGCKKVYKAEFTFGKTTDTLDREGIVTAEDGKLPTETELKEVLPSFIGEISQVPPEYSAVNVNGVRAYKLARKGAEVKLDAKTVNIYEIKLLNCVSSGNDVLSAEIEIVCGSGTYIRSLCRDIANKLGCLAYMSALTRTECAGYTLNDAADMKEFISAPEKFVRPELEIIEKLFTPADVDMDTAKRLKYGQSVACAYADGIYGITCGGEILGVGKIKDGTVRLETHLWNTI